MFRLEKSFEKVLYAIDVWINNGSGWIRHINLLNKHPEKVLKNDKKAVVELSYDRIQFPIHEEDFNKIDMKNNLCINVFGYEN